MSANSIATTQSTTQPAVLPYRISAADLRLAVDRIRKLGRDALDSALRSKSPYVQSALQTLGLATEDLDLTERGRELAYGRDDGSEAAVFLRIILEYPPFKKALTSCVASGAEASDLDSVVAFWGKTRIGVSDQNRRDGALVFLHLCGAAGLGNVLVGRSGAKTRILWNADAADLVGRASIGTAPSSASSAAPTGNRSVVLPDALEATAQRGRSVPDRVVEVGNEAFRIVLSSGTGVLELPHELAEADLMQLTAQLDAIIALLKVRGASSRIPIASSS